jgi:long-chain acyl-CoA synthetase
MSDVNAPALDFLAQRGGVRHAPALICADAAFSGAVLDAQSDRLAGDLAVAGVGSGERVALLLGNTPTFVVCVLALIKLRAAAVLLGTRLMKSEISDVLTRTGAAAIIGAPSTRTKIDAAIISDYGMPLSLDASLEPALLWRCAVEPRSGEEGELFLQLTSGISGRSKIVARTRANLAHELECFAARLALDSGDATLCPCPLAHAYGLVNGFLLPFFSGRPAILMDWFVPSALLDLVKRYRPRVLVGVPAMYQALCHVEAAAPLDLASLSICFSAGAPLSDNIAAAFHGRYGLAIHQQYGSTETGVIAINLEHARRDVQVVGQPVQTHEIEVVDDNGARRNADEAGEIIVRSDGSAACYIDDPVQSASRFRDGWYFTGDLGTVGADGTIRLHGRRTSFINVGGLKVDPVEVENVLLGLEGVVECAVVPAFDRLGGEVLKAVVVTTRSRSVAEIRKFCREQLAPHKVPRYVTFPDALPRSATGKVLTKYLLDDRGEL